MNTYFYDANCRFDIEAESEEVARTLLETKLGNIGAGYVETYIVGSKEDKKKVSICVYLDTITETAYDVQGNWRFKLHGGQDAENVATVKLDKEVFDEWYYKNRAAEWLCSSEEWIEEYMSSDYTESLIGWLKENNKEYETIVDKDVTILPYYTSFIDDKEKMRDFFLLTKEEFLESYSYLCEGEYDQTREEVALKWTELMCG